MKIVEGTTEDYKKLAHFHYRSSYLVAPKKIFALKRKDILEEAGRRKEWSK